MKTLLFLGLSVVAQLFLPLYALAKERVFVSSLPLEHAVRVMAGDEMEVWNPVNGDPRAWKPTKDQVREIQNSKLIVLNGAGFEEWSRVVSLPRSKLVVTARSFKKNWLAFEDKHAKAHRHGNKVHVHKGHDPHTWMSPKRYAQQIEAVYQHLLKLAVVEAPRLKQRYEKLKTEVFELDALWKEAAQRVAQRGYVLANHASYNYLAKDYDLKIESLDVSPDGNLSVADKDAIRKKQQQLKATQFWWESTPSKPQREFVEGELKMKSIVMATGELDSELNFVQLMRQNVSKL